MAKRFRDSNPGRRHKACAGPPGLSCGYPTDCRGLTTPADVVPVLRTSRNRSTSYPDGEFNDVAICRSSAMRNVRGESRAVMATSGSESSKHLLPTVDTAGRRPFQDSLGLEGPKHDPRVGNVQTARLAAGHLTGSSRHSRCTHGTERDAGSSLRRSRRVAVIASWRPHPGTAVAGTPRMPCPSCIRD